MNRLIVILSVLLGTAVLVACSGETSPAEEPAAAPTEVVESAVADGNSSPLIGTVWNLTSLNGTNLVPGTSITAEFSKDGIMAGSSGCNNYVAAYEVDGNNISFDLSGVATTLMACPEPVMSQASDYLAALKPAATNNIGSDAVNIQIAYDATTMHLEQIPSLPESLPTEGILQTILRTVAFSAEGHCPTC